MPFATLGVEKRHRAGGRHQRDADHDRREADPHRAHDGREHEDDAGDRPHQGAAAERRGDRGGDHRGRQGRDDRARPRAGREDTCERQRERQGEQGRELDRLADRGRRPGRGPQRIGGEVLDERVGRHGEERGHDHDPPPPGGGAVRRQGRRHEQAEARQLRPQAVVAPRHPVQGRVGVRGGDGRDRPPDAQRHGGGHRSEGQLGPWASPEPVGGEGKDERSEEAQRQDLGQNVTAVARAVEGEGHCDEKEGEGELLADRDRAREACPGGDAGERLGSGPVTTLSRDGHLRPCRGCCREG